MKLQKEPFSPANDLSRRKFIAGITATVGAGILLANPIVGLANSYLPRDTGWTVGQVMDLFIKQIPGAPYKNTVDTLKAGSPDTKITGIVTAMFPTIDVIRKAADAGANLIIAHEPTFYNHADETGWLAGSEVYQYKIDLLKQYNIAVWRNHDYIHTLVPDGVRMGVLKKLNWERCYNPTVTDLMVIPRITLKDLINYSKVKLNVPAVRYIGNLSQSCEKVLLLPGASGGRNHITELVKHKPDVLICGEIQEWETAEYVRDAIASGQTLSLIVLGHIASEEPGSEFMKTWLETHITGVRVTHIPSGNSLSFL